ncbi:MAG: hypothetical protein HYU41_20335 [Candidatus Rokubacteria bacterium]|nr:hypothetical protein [Candidatus Rokubacteria bacterium]
MTALKNLGIGLVVVAMTVAAVAVASAEPLRTTDGTRVSDRAWERVHGTVESVSGSTMKLKADDGRVMTVDMTVVSPMVQAVLAPGDRVTVIGSVGKDRATAQYIRHDEPLQASPKTEPKN